MAHEQGMRVFRQASDDAREMAMRVRTENSELCATFEITTMKSFQVIHDPTLNQNLNQLKGQAESAWRTFLEILRRLKDAVTAPAVMEQLQIIFRDESEFGCFA